MQVSIILTPSSLDVSSYRVPKPSSTLEVTMVFATLKSSTLSLAIVSPQDKRMTWSTPSLVVPSYRTSPFISATSFFLNGWEATSSSSFFFLDFGYILRSPLEATCDLSCTVKPFHIKLSSFVGSRSLLVTLFWLLLVGYVMVDNVLVRFLSCPLHTLSTSAQSSVRPFALSSSLSSIMMAILSF